MSVLVIIFIIILGIFLLLVEFLVIPGVTVFGIGGFMFIILGIGSAYYYHGPKTGHYTLLATVLISFFTMYYIFKKRTWKKVGLVANIESKVEPFETEKIHPGDAGKTITRLAPIGKAIVNGIMCEAKSESGFINENTEIVVTRVLTTQIIVKLKT
jgi:membrane-bound ClpP family serine protease